MCLRFYSGCVLCCLRLHLPRKEKVSVCSPLYCRMTLWYLCKPRKKDNVHTQKGNGLQSHSNTGSLVEYCDSPQGYVNSTFCIGAYPSMT